MISKLKFSKENTYYSIKSVDGVIVLVFCTLLDGAVYFYQVT